MTTVLYSDRPGNRAADRPDAAGDGSQNAGPVIVLTYPHAGADRLRSLLASTTKTLATSLITAMLARLGGRRWCEFAMASPSAAETFLQLYPQARFLCLHRACTDVIYAILHASAWGPAGPEFAPFTVTYPGSAVTALAAYWSAHTEALIAFEQAHPEVSRRVRYEDLADSDESDGLLAFLGLPVHASGKAERTVPGHDSQASGHHGRDPFPAGQIPASVLADADDLMTKLGYPPLVSSE
jgi:hypothetical protein